MEEIDKFKEWFNWVVEKKKKEFHVSDRTLTDILLHEASVLYHKVLVQDKLDGRNG